jgi:hypothetical protein
VDPFETNKSFFTTTAFVHAFERSDVRILKNNLMALADRTSISASTAPALSAAMRPVIRDHKEIQS